MQFLKSLKAICIAGLVAATSLISAWADEEAQTRELAIGKALLPAMLEDGSAEVPKPWRDAARRENLWLVLRPPLDEDALGKAISELDEPYVLIDTAASVVSRRFLAKLESWPKNSQAVYFLTDKSGILRRWGHVSEASAEAFSQPLEEWRRGRVIYDAHCARCHGEDGKATGYPFIRTLDGIGRRMGFDEIIEATSATGVVDLNQFDKAQLQAMAIYVAGL